MITSPWPESLFAFRRVWPALLRDLEPEYWEDNVSAYENGRSEQSPR